MRAGEEGKRERVSGKWLSLEREEVDLHNLDHHNLLDMNIDHHIQNILQIDRSCRKEVDNLREEEELGVGRLENVIDKELERSNSLKQSGSGQGGQFGGLLSRMNGLYSYGSGPDRVDGEEADRFEAEGEAAKVKDEDVRLKPIKRIQRESRFNGLLEVEYRNSILILKRIPFKKTDTSLVDDWLQSCECAAVLVSSLLSSPIPPFLFFWT